ncbi:hypothetical protein HFO61_30635 [Rhizobium leguminosarum]|uniref:hypothetical protein n=1 Tax=Rhizobium leguminosarum TaxID=384 RepID=UPI001C9627BB|nr:hypothetical protein [Rhizobium leguminosarum]MBY5551104.1 hypothetical protein [Rhizobium leguminosarum]
MSNDLFGTIAKAYMFADMLTPPKQAQVIHTGIDESDLANAVDARTRQANKLIRKANGIIRDLNTENQKLRNAMTAARERVMEAARQQSEYTAELEIQNRLLREELARVDEEKAELERRLNTLENSSNVLTNVDIMDNRETVSNGR